MKKNLSIIKFGFIALALGFISPTVSVDMDKTGVDSSTVSTSALASFMPIGISISLLNKAEARPVHRQTRRVARRTSRRTSRRVNRRHNAARYYGGGHHHHHHHYGYYRGAPILAFGAAVAVGSIIAASTMPPSCTTVHYGGVAYRRCNGTYYMPMYQGDTLVYKVVPAPY